jgi:hypothetical protein
MYRDLQRVEAVATEVVRAGHTAVATPLVEVDPLQEQGEEVAVIRAIRQCHTDPLAQVEGMQTSSVVEAANQ